MVATSPLAIVALVAKLIKNVSNRDKFLKVLQYSMKIRLLKGTSSLNKETADVLRSLASVLSLSRLVYRLGDWLEPLHDVINDGPKMSLPYFETIISLCNAAVDDILCLNKATKGLWPMMSKPLQSSLDLWSSKLWLSSTFINMAILFKKMPQDKLKASTDQKLAMAKMVCDVVFCLYDIYGWEWMSELPILSGIIAACLGILRSALK